MTKYLKVLMYKLHGVAILFMVLMILNLTSCDDDSDQFGLNLLPPSDKMQSGIIDTIEIDLSQVNMPFYYTTGNDPLIGSAEDPVFGRIWAGLGTDLFFPEGFDTSYFGKKIVITDIIMSMHFDSVFYHNPDPSDPFDHSFSFNIYTLSKPIQRDSSYSQNISPKTFLNGSRMLMAKTIEYPVNNTTVFRLPTQSYSYFDRIFEIDSNKFTIDTFRYQKGVYGLFINPVYQKGKDIIVRFNTSNDKKSFMRIYFKVLSSEGNTEVSEDSITAYFYSYYYDKNNKLVYGNAGLSFVTLDYSKAKLKTRLNGSTNDSLFYILGESNLRAKIDFGNLKKLIGKGQYNIIKADLLIPFEKNLYNPSFNYSTKTSMLKDVHLRVEVKTDSIVAYSRYFGTNIYEAYLDTVSTSYVIDVTDYIHQFISQKTTIESLYFYPKYQYNLQTAFLKNNLKLKIKYLKY